MAVTQARIFNLVKGIPDGEDLTEDVAAARALVAEHLDGLGLAISLLDQIELRVAAHFVAIRFDLGRTIDSDVFGVARESYSGRYGEVFGPGLMSTVFGQAAIGMDPSNTLKTLGLDKAELRFV